MTICPVCEKPVLDGERVRLQALAVYSKAPIPDTHGLDVVEEEWIEHEACSDYKEIA